LTVGFVSAVGRLIPTDINATGQVTDPRYYPNDTAINPGNSGGVLLNDSGKVIGVTQSIDTSSGHLPVLGLPSRIHCRTGYPALINTGVYQHPYLGVTVTSLDPAQLAQ